MGTNSSMTSEGKAKIKFDKYIDDKGNVHISFSGEDDKAIFRLISGKDSIKDWQTEFLKMFERGAGGESQAGRLIESCDRLTIPDFSEWNENGFTFLRVVCGLSRAIIDVKKQSERKNKNDKLSIIRNSVVICALKTAFDFIKVHLLRGKNKIEQHDYIDIESIQLEKTLMKIEELLKENPIINFKVFLKSIDQIRMPIGGFIIHGAQHYCQLKKDGFEYIPMECWSAFLEKEPGSKQSLPVLFENFDLLEEIVLNQVRRADSTGENSEPLMKSFGCFCQALVTFLDNDQSGYYIDIRDRVIPQLCAFIVKDEFFDFDEQKDYLDIILKSKNLTKEKKHEILKEIVIDVQEDYKNAKIKNKMAISNSHEKESRMMTIISTISRHYFDRFELEDSLSYWDTLKPGIKDLLLRIIIWVYRRPYLITLYGYILTFSLLFFLEDKSLYSVLRCSILWVTIAIAFVIFLIIGVFIFYRFLFRKNRGVPYIELLFHPLLIANLVGLSIIPLAEESWKIGTKISHFYWGLLCLFLYGMSFIYIYIEVYKVFRLKQARRNGDESAKKESTMYRSIRVSFQLFCIQVFQSLLFSTFASFILAQLFLSKEKITCLLHKGIGLQLNLFYSDRYVVYVFPKLIVLWTGLILFIGAFVQLFWQSRGKPS